jgi:hypothetical protein
MKHNNNILRSQVLALFILLISAISINAQIIQWTQTYGSPGDDGSQSMIATNDGGLVIAGFKSSYAYSYKDVLLMKTDASGVEIWSRTYNLHLNVLCRSPDFRQRIIIGNDRSESQIFDPF